MDKLGAMRAFVAVVDSGGFGRAAERLALPKATVSQRVQALEAALGVRLLQRTTRRVTPTVDGEAYHGRCLRWLAEIDEAERALRGEAERPSGVLRVEMLASLARWIVAPALPDFVERHPGIELRLGCADRLVDLLEDGVDCAVRGGVLPSSSLVARHVVDVTLALYASPSYVSRAGVPDGPDALATHRRLGWLDGRSGRPEDWTLGRADAAARVVGPPTLAFDDGEACLAACIAGAGIAPAAPFAADAAVRAGALVPVLAGWSTGTRPVHVVWPSRRHLAPRVRVFVDWVTALVREHPGMAAVHR
ncbi:MAG: hypothetical protein RJA99_2390 [Pseudomonadota bacterium]|jgi:LysR family transcriptional regulator for bpeEF and oprC